MPPKKSLGKRNASKGALPEEDKKKPVEEVKEPKGKKRQKKATATPTPLEPVAEVQDSDIEELTESSDTLSQASRKSTITQRQFQAGGMLKEMLKWQNKLRSEQSSMVSQLKKVAETGTDEEYAAYLSKYAILKEAGDGIALDIEVLNDIYKAFGKPIPTINDYQKQLEDVMSELVDLSKRFNDPNEDPIAIQIEFNNAKKDKLKLTQLLIASNQLSEIVNEQYEQLESRAFFNQEGDLIASEGDLDLKDYREEKVMQKILDSGLGERLAQRAQYISIPQMKGPAQPVPEAKITFKGKGMLKDRLGSQQYVAPIAQGSQDIVQVIGTQLNQGAVSVFNRINDSSKRIVDGSLVPSKGSEVTYYKQGDKVQTMEMITGTMGRMFHKDAHIVKRQNNFLKAYELIEPAHWPTRGYKQYRLPPALVECREANAKAYRSFFDQTRAALELNDFEKERFTQQTRDQLLRRIIEDKTDSIIKDPEEERYLRLVYGQMEAEREDNQEPDAEEKTKLKDFTNPLANLSTVATEIRTIPADSKDRFPLHQKYSDKLGITPQQLNATMGKDKYQLKMNELKELAVGVEQPHEVFLIRALGTAPRDKIAYNVHDINLSKLYPGRMAISQINRELISLLQKQGAYKNIASSMAEKNLNPDRLNQSGRNLHFYTALKEDYPPANFAQTELISPLISTFTMYHQYDRRNESEYNGTKSKQKRFINSNIEAMDRVLHDRYRNEFVDYGRNFKTAVQNKSGRQYFLLPTQLLTKRLRNDMLLDQQVDIGNGYADTIPTVQPSNPTGVPHNLNDGWAQIYGPLYQSLYNQLGHFHLLDEMHPPYPQAGIHNHLNNVPAFVNMLKSFFDVKENLFPQSDLNELRYRLFLLQSAYRSRGTNLSDREIQAGIRAMMGWQMLKVLNYQKVEGDAAEQVSQKTQKHMSYLQIPISLGQVQRKLNEQELEWAQDQLLAQENGPDTLIGHLQMLTNAIAEDLSSMMPSPDSANDMLAYASGAFFQRAPGPISPEVDTVFGHSFLLAGLQLTINQLEVMKGNAGTQSESHRAMTDFSTLKDDVYPLTIFQPGYTRTSGGKQEVDFNPMVAVDNLLAGLSEIDTWLPKYSKELYDPRQLNLAALRKKEKYLESADEKPLLQEEIARFSAYNEARMNATNNNRSKQALNRSANENVEKIANLAGEEVAQGAVNALHQSVGASLTLENVPAVYEYKYPQFRGKTITALKKRLQRLDETLAETNLEEVRELIEFLQRADNIQTQNDLKQKVKFYDQIALDNIDQLKEGFVQAAIQSVGQDSINQSFQALRYDSAVRMIQGVWDATPPATRSKTLKHTDAPFHNHYHSIKSCYMCGLAQKNTEESHGEGYQFTMCCGKPLHLSCLEESAQYGSGTVLIGSQYTCNACGFLPTGLVSHRNMSIAVLRAIEGLPYNPLNESAAWSSKIALLAERHYANKDNSSSAVIPYHTKLYEDLFKEGFQQTPAGKEWTKENMQASLTRDEPYYITTHNRPQSSREVGSGSWDYDKVQAVNELYQYSLRNVMQMLGGAKTPSYSTQELYLQNQATLEALVSQDQINNQQLKYEFLFTRAAEYIETTNNFTGGVRTLVNGLFNDYITFVTADQERFAEMKEQMFYEAMKVDPQLGRIQFASGQDLYGYVLDANRLLAGDLQEDFPQLDNFGKKQINFDDLFSLPNVQIVMHGHVPTPFEQLALPAPEEVPPMQQMAQPIVDAAMPEQEPAVDQDQQMDQAESLVPVPAQPPLAPVPPPPQVQQEFVMIDTSSKPKPLSPIQSYLPVPFSSPYQQPAQVSLGFVPPPMPVFTEEDFKALGNDFKADYFAGLMLKDQRIPLPGEEEEEMKMAQSVQRTRVKTREDIEQEELDARMALEIARDSMEEFGIPAIGQLDPLSSQRQAQADAVRGISQQARQEIEDTLLAATLSDMKQPFKGPIQMGRTLEEKMGKPAKKPPPPQRESRFAIPFSGNIVQQVVDSIRNTPPVQPQPPQPEPSQFTPNPAPMQIQQPPPPIPTLSTIQQQQDVPSQPQPEPVTTMPMPTFDDQSVPETQQQNQNMQLLDNILSMQEATSQAQTLLIASQAQVGLNAILQVTQEETKQEIVNTAANAIGAILNGKPPNDPDNPDNSSSDSFSSSSLSDSQHPGVDIALFRKVKAKVAKLSKSAAEGKATELVYARMMRALQQETRKQEQKVQQAVSQANKANIERQFISADKQHSLKALNLSQKKLERELATEKGKSQKQQSDFEREKKALEDMGSKQQATISQQTTHIQQQHNDIIALQSQLQFREQLIAQFQSSEAADLVNRAAQLEANYSQNVQNAANQIAEQKLAERVREYERTRLANLPAQTPAEVLKETQLLNKQQAEAIRNINQQRLSMTSELAAKKAELEATNSVELIKMREQFKHVRMADALETAQDKLAKRTELNIKKLEFYEKEETKDLQKKVKEANDKYDKEHEAKLKAQNEEEKFKEKLSTANKDLTQARTKINELEAAQKVYEGEVQVKIMSELKEANQKFTVMKGPLVELMKFVEKKVGTIDPTGMQKIMADFNAVSQANIAAIQSVNQALGSVYSNPQRPEYQRAQPAERQRMDLMQQQWVEYTKLMTQGLHVRGNYLTDYKDFGDYLEATSATQLEEDMRVLNEKKTKKMRVLNDAVQKKQHLEELFREVQNFKSVYSQHAPQVNQMLAEVRGWLNGNPHGMGFNDNPYWAASGVANATEGSHVDWGKVEQAFSQDIQYFERKARNANDSLAKVNNLKGLAEKRTQSLQERGLKTFNLQKQINEVDRMINPQALNPNYAPPFPNPMLLDSAHDTQAIERTLNAAFRWIQANEGTVTQNANVAALLQDVSQSGNELLNKYQTLHKKLTQAQIPYNENIRQLDRLLAQTATQGWNVPVPQVINVATFPSVNAAVAQMRGQADRLQNFLTENETALLKATSVGNHAKEMIRETERFVNRYQTEILGLRKQEEELAELVRTTGFQFRTIDTIQDAIDQQTGVRRPLHQQHRYFEPEAIRQFKQQLENLHATIRRQHAREDEEYAKVQQYYSQIKETIQEGKSLRKAKKKALTDVYSDLEVEISKGRIVQPQGYQFGRQQDLGNITNLLQGAIRQQTAESDRVQRDVVLMKSRLQKLQETGRNLDVSASEFANLNTKYQQMVLEQQQKRAAIDALVRFEGLMNGNLAQLQPADRARFDQLCVQYGMLSPQQLINADTEFETVYQQNRGKYSPAVDVALATYSNNAEGARAGYQRTVSKIAFIQQQSPGLVPITNAIKDTYKDLAIAQRQRLGMLSRMFRPNLQQEVGFVEFEAQVRESQHELLEKTSSKLLEDLQSIKQNLGSLERVQDKLMEIVGVQKQLYVVDRAGYNALHDQIRHNKGRTGGLANDALIKLQAFAQEGLLCDGTVRTVIKPLTVDGVLKSLDDLEKHIESTYNEQGRLILFDQIAKAAQTTVESVLDKYWEFHQRLSHKKYRPYRAPRDVFDLDDDQGPGGGGGGNRSVQRNSASFGTARDSSSVGDGRHPTLIMGNRSLVQQASGQFFSPPRPPPGHQPPPPPAGPGLQMPAPPAPPAGQMPPQPLPGQVPPGGPPGDDGGDDGNGSAFDANEGDEDERMNVAELIAQGERDRNDPGFALNIAMELQKLKQQVGVKQVAGLVADMVIKNMSNIFTRGGITDYNEEELFQAISMQEQDIIPLSREQMVRNVTDIFHVFQDEVRDAIIQKTAGFIHQNLAPLIDNLDPNGVTQLILGNNDYAYGKLLEQDYQASQQLANTKARIDKLKQESELWVRATEEANADFNGLAEQLIVSRLPNPRMEVSQETLHIPQSSLYFTDVPRIVGASLNFKKGQSIYDFQGQEFVYHIQDRIERERNPNGQNAIKSTLYNIREANLNEVKSREEINNIMNQQAYQVEPEIVLGAQRQILAIGGLGLKVGGSVAAFSSKPLATIEFQTLNSQNRLMWTLCRNAKDITDHFCVPIYVQMTSGKLVPPQQIEQLKAVMNTLLQADQRMFSSIDGLNQETRHWHGLEQIEWENLMHTLIRDAFNPERGITDEILRHYQLTRNSHPTDATNCMAYVRNTIGKAIQHNSAIAQSNYEQVDRLIDQMDNNDEERKAMNDFNRKAESVADQLQKNVTQRLSSLALKQMIPEEEVKKMEREFKSALNLPRIFHGSNVGGYFQNAAQGNAAYAQDQRPYMAFQDSAAVRQQQQQQQQGNQQSSTQPTQPTQSTQPNQQQQQQQQYNPNQQQSNTRQAGTGTSRFNDDLFKAASSLGKFTKDDINLLRYIRYDKRQGKFLRRNQDGTERDLTSKEATQLYRIILRIAVIMYAKVFEDLSKEDLSKGTKKLQQDIQQNIKSQPEKIIEALNILSSKYVRKRDTKYDRKMNDE